MVEGVREQTLVTSDGVRIAADLVPGLPGSDPSTVIVVVHGFTVSRSKPRLAKVVAGLRPYASVVSIDMRGHGASGGQTTVGHFEVLDVAAGVAWARSLGFSKVVTVGFSLGGAVVLREAALVDEPDARPDAVVCVSAPAFWFYRGTKVMRRAHFLVETWLGRRVLHAGKSTRVSGAGWPDPAPVPPHLAAGRLGVLPLLIVHGDVDRYFPLEHPEAIYRSAVAGGVDAELLVFPGYGHAEREVTDEILASIGAWVRKVTREEGGNS